MEASTKKGLFIVSGLLLAGGIIAYLYFKKKPSLPGSEVKNNGSNSGNGAIDLQIKSDKKPEVQQVKTQSEIPKASVQTQPVQAKIVKSDDVLSSNVNGGNNKALYSLANGLSVYNMNNQVALKTTANKYLGIIQSARKTPTGQYIITFTINGVKYYMTSTGTGIKVN